MANANFVELETCLADALAYCAQKPDHDFVAYFQPRLEYVARKFEESRTMTDRQFIRWKTDERNDKLAWKYLALELKATASMLRRKNAIDSPSRNILHWDTEKLTAAVEEMLDYLAENADAIEEAPAAADRLAKKLDSARKGMESRDDTLEDYARLARFRTEALGSVNNLLGEFRQAMRRELGKKHPEYLSIRWPQVLAPDYPVL